MNLAMLPDDLAHPTILFYIYGPCAFDVGAIVRDAKSKEDLHDTLVRFFKPYFSLLDNYDANKPECVPKATLATAWTNDEYSGYGSYSCFQTGLEEGDKDIEAMREGMPEQGIWFAGEHVSPFVALGTTTGAYWSGEAVAERIIKRHSDEKA